MRPGLSIRGDNDERSGHPARQRLRPVDRHAAAPLKRRSLLARAAMAPVATTAVGLLGTPAEAEALTLTPPDTVDCYDVGDSLLQLGARRCRW